jgi:hypothetical protein
MTICVLSHIHLPPSHGISITFDFFEKVLYLTSWCATLFTLQLQATAVDGYHIIRKERAILNVQSTADLASLTVHHHHIGSNTRRRG